LDERFPGWDDAQTAGDDASFNPTLDMHGPSLPVPYESGDLLPLRDSDKEPTHFAARNRSKMHASPLLPSREFGHDLADWRNGPAH
jgi:hypothetical protein